MRTLLNIIWLVLCGFWMALAYVIAGIICCILIITIPFGIASFRIAGFALWPFGRTIVQDPNSGAPSLIGNVIWFVFAGLWLGIASFKMVPISLLPLGREIVPSDQVFYAPSGA